MESNAVILHNFWQPQPTLPCFGLQCSISKKTRITVSLSSMQEVFAESLLPKQAWRDPKEVRLHQNIFTRKVIIIICYNYSHPASLYLTSPRPRFTRPHVPYLMSSSPSSLVPKSQVPTHASRCPRPPVPVPLLYTAPFSCNYCTSVFLPAWFVFGGIPTASHMSFRILFSLFTPIACA